MSTADSFVVEKPEKFTTRRGYRNIKRPDFIMKKSRNRKSCCPCNYSEADSSENRLKIIKPNSSEKRVSIAKLSIECRSRKEMRDNIIKKLQKLLSEIR